MAPAEGDELRRWHRQQSSVSYEGLKMMCDVPDVL